jgi:hypothetical protein
VIGEVFGDHPNNGGGGVDYQDPVRHMFLEVRVRREVRPEYVDHVIQRPYRDSQTGRLTSGLSVITLFGNALFLYCEESPDCTERTYVWRSGPDLVVTVTAHAYDRGVTPEAGPRRDVPCPEPTELLQAYLERYPSSLTQNWEVPVWSWIQDEARAREHLHTAVALRLAGAKYWLAMAARISIEQVRDVDLRKIERQLKEFARLRQAHLNGPDAETEHKRIKAIKQLAPQPRLSKLQELMQEYQAWWDRNVGVLVVVPALPPPVTPSPVPSTPTAVPTP